MKITVLAAAAFLMLVGWTVPASATTSNSVDPMSACGGTSKKKKKTKGDGNSVVQDNHDAKKSACGCGGSKKKKKKKKGDGTSVAEDNTSALCGGCGCDSKKKKKKKKGKK